MNRVRRFLGTALAAILVVVPAFVAPSTALAAGPASQMFFTDGPNGYAQNGHVQTPAVTFQPSGSAPYAEVVFLPQDTPMVTGFLGADGVQIAPGTYSNATFPDSPGHPYFRTYDAQVCWHPPSTGSGEFVVHEVEFDGGGILTKLAVDLTSTCAGETIKHYRVVRFNSSVAVSWLEIPSQTAIGATHVGIPTDRTISVTNPGSTTRHVAGVGLSGAQAGQFAIQADGCSGEDIVAGGTCAVVIRALPTQVGQSSALVTVTSDAFDAEMVGRVTQDATIATAVSLAGTDPVARANIPFTAHATVSPTPVHGSVKFFVDGLFRGSASVDPNTGTAATELTGETFGNHTLVAQFTGQTGWDNSASDPLTIAFKHATSVTLTSSRNPAPTGASVTLTASADQSALPSTGTLTITDETTATVLASGPIGGAVHSLAVTTTFDSIGTHVITASLDSGDPDYVDATDELNQVVAVDDFVDATGLGFGAPSIYPVKDGFRDTLPIVGVRNENVGVAITVTSSATGKVVARATIPAGMGAYTWAWTGRTSTGAILPAGTYVVRQVLTDQATNNLSWSKSVGLSTRRLYTYTFSKTLNGNQFQEYGGALNGTVHKQNTPYPNEVRLNAWSPGYAAAEWAFTLPSASVNKSLRFYVIGNSSGPAVMAVWNPSLGSFLDVDAYDGARLLGRPYATYGVSVPPATHISAHRVHGLVYVGDPFSTGTVNVAKVKVAFTYGLLR